MAASSFERRSFCFALCALGMVSLGCSAGVGEGEVTGVIFAPGCGLNGEAFDLQPNFFAADPTLDFLDIRLQRGSGFEDVSDGVDISVRSASEVAANLGVPIALEDPLVLPSTPTADRPLVAMSVYLNRTCPIDRPAIPVAYGAVSGDITFTAIYAPELPSTGLEISGSFSDVRFEDPSDPNHRNATLSGHFTFIFNRGRPAQRFP